MSHLADDQLTIVAPSRWLLELSQLSPVTGRFRHIHIPNASWAETPELASSERGKIALGLPPNKKLVLFVSDNLRNPRKGIDLLFEAARLITNPDDVHFVGIGQPTDRPRGISVTFTGAIADDAARARFFACADVLVSPSMAENCPLVVIEALSCGTPVVAFKVGGTPELLDEDSGVIVETRSAQALAASLDHALFAKTFDRDHIRERAARFSPANVWRQYHDVYQEALATA
jgi:glycosyltransferase involved in cell wall biosynthesis